MLNAYDVLRMRRSTHGTELVHSLGQVPVLYFNMYFGWLVVPILLWTSTTVLLFATIGITDYGKTPIWKGSVLTLLDCRERHNELGPDWRVHKQIEVAAQTIRLVGRDEGHWYLREIH